ncbi:MAG TPA: tyrosine-type recombinase/integrase [Jiangellaceae bacterium]|nr:tyrosine-type recombinase/integrase [Jiangellaceae bacterium]
MASIKHDGRAWRARYYDPTGKRREKRFDRKVDASRWLNEQTAQHVTGTFVEPKLGQVTVGEWSARWLSSKANVKPSTRDRYAGILTAHVAPAWGQVRLVDVTHADVQSWVSSLSASGLSAGSVHKVHRVLSMVLGLAVRDGRLPRNPAAGVNLPRAAKAEKRYLRTGEVDDLADAAGPGRLVVLVLAYTGLRWGELTALQVSRLDLLRRRIHVAESVTELSDGRLDWGLPKSHERRWVPVPRFLVDELAEHVAGKAPEDLVFTSPKGAVLRVRGARRSWFDRAVEASGVPEGLHPHELRHTAASLAVSAGREREGRAADARPRKGVNDPRRVRRPVRRRPRSGRRPARRDPGWRGQDRGTWEGN